VVLAIVAAVGLSIWLLRLERKLVSRSVGWSLLALRMSILTALLITLSQPLLTQRFDVSRHGRIILAIDASLSMETQDHHASRAEKLRWAQALGMLGNAETNPLIDAWVVAAESGKEPDWLGG
jgi:predicted PurR-regulated permease PerM